MPLDRPDIQELRAIVDWVNLSDDVRELSIRFGEVELFISRDRHRADGSATVAAAPVAIVAPAPALAPPPVADPRPAPAAAELAADEVLIKAPMVGVFYASPKPGDPPFVSVGDAVRPDSVLCIVEVMKLMSNIEAGVAGTVSRILVANEEAVEYGQPLMVITRNG